MQKQAMTIVKMSFVTVLLVSVVALGAVLRRTDAAFTGEEAHRGLVDCPPEEDVFFNMNITIEGDGKTSDCTWSDAYNIGRMLQRVVNEIEREFSDARTEIEFTVCPVPISDAERDQRALQEAHQARNLTASDSFTYICGGRYRSCSSDNGNNNRALAVSADSVCEISERAVYASAVADAAVKEAKAEFHARVKDALHCDDIGMGQREVILTKTALEECRKERDSAMAEAETARQMCDLASPSSTSKELIEYMATARKAAFNSMGAVEKARSWLLTIISGFGSKVCGQVQVPASGVSGQALYDLTNQAIYGAEMANMATNLTQMAYMDMTERAAMDCEALRRAEETITRARESLSTCLEAAKHASSEASRAQTQLDRATSTPITTSELQKMIQDATRASTEAMNAAKNTQTLYFRVKEQVGTDVCGQVAERGRSGATSVSEVCRFASTATFGGNMATAAVKAAEASLDQLLRGVLKCTNSVGLTLIRSAKKSLHLCRRARRVALSKGKKAHLQCELASEGLSRQEVDKIQQMTERTSRVAMAHAKRAVRLSKRMSNELDINICRGEIPFEETGPNVSAAAVCQVTDGAVAGAAIASTALNAADEEFSILNERVLSCYDLQAGQEIVSVAKGVLNQCRSSRKRALIIARRARKQCLKARRATSEEELRRLMRSAEAFLDDATNATARTKRYYLQLVNEFDGKFCSEIVTESTPALDSQAIESSATSTRGINQEQGPTETPVAVNELLNAIGSELYEKIPEHLLHEYHVSAIGRDCATEGFNIDVRMDELPRLEDRAFWVTYENCAYV